MNKEFVHPNSACVLCVRERECVFVCVCVPMAPIDDRIGVRSVAELTVPLRSRCFEVTQRKVNDDQRRDGARHDDVCILIIYVNSANADLLPVIKHHRNKSVSGWCIGMSLFIAELRCLQVGNNLLMVRL